MRQHGLILPNRTRSWLAKYTDALRMQNGSSTTAGRFIAFMQLTTGIAFDKLIEGLQYEHDLRKFIIKLVIIMCSVCLCGTSNLSTVLMFYSCRLYELRSNGITTYNGGRIFQKLRAQRTSRIRTKPTTAYEWKHLVPDENQQLSGAGQIMKHCLDLHTLPVKRKSTPLNIIGLAPFKI